MEIYVHLSGTADLKLAELPPESTLEEVIASLGANEQAQVWLEDGKEPLERTASLADVGVEQRGHIHIGTCKKVAVTVRYGGDSKSRDVPPAATIASVFAWATGPKGFKLAPNERAKHTLGICDTLTEPDRSDHIGSFVVDECSLCLDLAPKERFEG